MRCGHEKCSGSSLETQFMHETQSNSQGKTLYYVYADGFHENVIDKYVVIF